MLFANSVMAEVSLPYGITPLNGEIRLLFRPGFESTCTSKTEPETETQESVTRLFLDPAGQLKLQMKADTFTLNADVKHDGSEVIMNSFKFDSGDNKGDKYIAEIIKGFENLYTTFSPIGKHLQQDSELSAANLCEIFPGGKSSFFSTFKRKVSGIVQIHGRPSLILKSDIKTSCTIDKLGQIAISGYAWESFDLQSGISSDSGSQMLLKIGSNPEVNMKTVSSCVITDTTQAIAIPGGKSLEGRLVELKTLMEKGLITHEQYEQKRNDILKSL